VSDPQEAGRELVGDFAGADGLLGAAQSSRLEQLGPVRVTRSGRIGPLVVMARRVNPGAFAAVALTAPFAVTLETALARDEIAGIQFRARAGVFPLRRYNANADALKKKSPACLTGLCDSGDRQGD
jgi:hypothetical protein